MRFSAWSLARVSWVPDGLCRRDAGQSPDVVHSRLFVHSELVHSELEDLASVELRSWRDDRHRGAEWKSSRASGGSWC